MFSKNISLKALNTFGIDSVASQYICLKSMSEFDKLVSEQSWKEHPFFILGGGSNVLFPSIYQGLIIHVCNKGIKIVEEDFECVLIEVAAGEIWQDFVEWTVLKGYNGIENLALIPGYCGSTPVQNIGAYGIEAKDVIERVNFVEIESGFHKSILVSDCKFDYRNSIFKQEYRNKVIVTSVVYKLYKNNKTNLSYRSLKDFFDKSNNLNPTVKDVYDAVVSIRRSKLPDHNEIGNAGSFFKNPIITLSDFDKLKSNFSELTFWEVSENEVKLSAAQLIERCGWRGKRIGEVGVHVNQALVLVNYGKATGNDVLNLSKNIIEDVKERFDIEIEPEVNVLY